jgi:glycosyltransferase involved in cell wall biosynthesis
MKILFSSHTFYPNLGGLEAVSLMLAREFARAGHQVIVITRTPGGEDEPEFPFRLVRRPAARELLRLTAWAEVVFHNNLSLRTAWSLLLVRRPWVVAHHIWLPRGHNLRGAKAAFKRLVLRKASGIAISHAIAEDFATPCTVIPDPYDDTTFRVLPGIERNRELLFVGRFVSDKGLPVLLHALAGLRSEGVIPGLTVVGSGPAETAWRRLADQLELADQVRFVGPMRGQMLAEEMNRHRVLVVPSRWREPFGIVALEGMACGCVVVGSEGGGLCEAIGPGGLTYPNGDSAGLVQRLKVALTDDQATARCRDAAPGHLALHRPTQVAANYLAVFEHALRGATNVRTV